MICIVTSALSTIIVYQYFRDNWLISECINKYQQEPESFGIRNSYSKQTMMQMKDD